MQPRRNDYDITNRIQTTNAESVRDEVLRLYNLLYAGATGVSSHQLDIVFNDVGRLYTGTYPGYRACDTAYHDLQHVMDVTLAMARLMDGYERSRKDTPLLGSKLFELGIITALFHDVGYLREINDTVAPMVRFIPHSMYREVQLSCANICPRLACRTMQNHALS